MDTNMTSPKTTELNQDNEWLKALAKNEFKKSVKKVIPEHLLSSPHQKALRNTYGS